MSTTNPSDTGAGSASGTNPLLPPWGGPFGGVPPFDRITFEHFEPALAAAMSEKLEAAEAIAGDRSPADFENTFIALERAGATLDRVLAVYGVWSSNLSSAPFRALEREMAPKLAALSDRITQNERLFRRIEAVYAALDRGDADPEQRRLAWLYHMRFVRAGARLDAAAKSRLAEVNQRLARLRTQYSQNILADETDQYLVLERESGLAGLPESVRAAAAAAAEAKDLPGKWVILNTRSAVEPFLTYADRRDLREKAWRMWICRGDLGGETDNNALAAEILKLRAEKAALLGYPSHAHWRLEDSMAGSPDRAMELMQAVWTPAVERVREEVAAMAPFVAGNGAGQVAPWDYRYYADKVAEARFAVDQDRVKQYLQLDRLRDAMFWVAERLLGFRFGRVEDVPVFHPDVEAWEVTDTGSGRHVGLFYFDPFARDGKRSGAWMTGYRRQHRLDGEATPIVSNNCNFVRATPGEPALLSWDDARTLFHEFGHALHGLASAVTYPSLSGTSVPRDYVEFPSQLLEHWLSTCEVQERFALHHRSGAPMPRELADRIEEASRFNQGSTTAEYLASAMVDMKLHLADPAEVDPGRFERDALAEIGMPPEVAMRHRPQHFSHIFAGDGYSAAYYSYLWADMLTADAYEAFQEAGGPYDRELADRLRRHVLSAGNAVDPAEAFRSFRGRDPKIAALLRKRGLVTPGAARR